MTYHILLIMWCCTEILKFIHQFWLLELVLCSSVQSQEKAYVFTHMYILHIYILHMPHAQCTHHTHTCRNITNTHTSILCTHTHQEYYIGIHHTHKHPTHYTLLTLEAKHSDTLVVSIL